MFVPMMNELLDASPQVTDRGEGAAADARWVMRRKKRSTRFSHELLVGMKCTWKRGCRVNQAHTLGCLCVA